MLRNYQYLIDVYKHGDKFCAIVREHGIEIYRMYDEDYTKLKSNAKKMFKNSRIHNNTNFGERC